MAARGDSGERPLYMISVAADLAGMHPQTLRIYERRQLIRPMRSGGNTRLYSDADIERLRLIQQLTQDEGVNLAGVERILEMSEELDRLHAEADRLRQSVRQLQDRLAREADRVHRTYRAEMVLVKHGHLAAARRRDEKG